MTFASGVGQGLARIVFGGALVWAGAAVAQSPLGDLPAAAQARLPEVAELTQQLTDRPGDAVRVIVEFAAPALPDGIQSGTAQGDAAQIAGVAAVQDRILGRVLGTAADGAQADAGLGLRRLTYSPLFALNADAALIAALAADPEVLRIVIDRPEPPALSASLPVIGMPAAYAAGATGNGQTVAVLDSGARVTHEFLSSRITQGACFNSNVPSLQATSRCPGGATQAFTIASSDDCTGATIRGCGHGTHVAGTAAGFNTALQAGEPAHGVARDARIMSINVFSLLPGSRCARLPAGFDSCIGSFVSDQIAALEHVFSQRTATTFAAVNMSLGGELSDTACTGDPRRGIILQLTEAGIAVVTAAGNNGSDTQVTAPGCIPEAITVANTTINDELTASSNWGPLVDLVAPGNAIVASYIDGSSDTFYAAQSGTSMAAPHVAGAFAAIRSARPTATVAEILTALRDTGTGITWAGTTVPRINVAAALNALPDTNVATTTTLSGPATSNTGQSVTFTANVTAASGTPTGTVSFRRNGVEFVAAALGNGQAQGSTSSLPAGTHQITAHYLGAAGFNPSISAAQTIVVSSPPAPPNDNFADRRVISGPGVVTGTNVGATREAGEPDHWEGIPRAHSVWWTFTPTAPGDAIISTCDSGFATVMAVYTGSQVDDLNDVVYGDYVDSCGFSGSAGLTVTVGVPYHIVVASLEGETGDIALRVDFPVAPRTTTTTLAGPISGLTGQVLTYSATVAATGATPTGTVSFRLGDAEFATAALNGQGVASAQADFPAGTHQITAHYLGAAGFIPSQSGPLEVLISQAPAQIIEFVGGGSVFEFTAACASGGWANTPHPARLRYGPGEVNGMPSQVGILFPSGAEHLQTWHALAQSTLNYDALGRQMWTLFVLQQPFPRMTPVQRRITQPANGTDIAQATEVMLRLRVSGFGGIPGCGATVAGVLRRAG